MKILQTDLTTLIDSLKSPGTSLLVVDSKLCPHSKRLLGEIEIASSLTSSSSTGAVVMHILDLSKHVGPGIRDLTWLPGVPCLLVAAKVHLGVDAFAKSRELCQSAQGITIHHLP